MAFLGFLIALVLFFHYKRRLRHYHRRHRFEDEMHFGSARAMSWHEEWHRQWATKFQHEAKRLREARRSWDREFRRRNREVQRNARRYGVPFPFGVSEGTSGPARPEPQTNGAGRGNGAPRDDARGQL